MASASASRIASFALSDEADFLLLDAGHVSLPSIATGSNCDDLATRLVRSSINTRLGASRMSSVLV